MADAEEASSFLKGVTRDADALYEHLTKVLLKVVKTNPDDAFEAFEALSVQVKQETAAGSALNQEAVEVVADVDDAKEKERALAAAQSTLDLISPPKKKPAEGEEEEEEEEEEEPEKAPIPDVMAEAALLQMAGVGLGEEEVYSLMLSLQTLTTKNELQNVRFWGKITGTEKDYYVVEAKQDEYPEPEEGQEPPPKQEPMGTGCNECIYYVTNNPSEPWTKLDPVQPEHINAARQMKRYLTGELTAPVLGFPRFPWGEAAYLRTQIARISSDTVLCPAGQFLVEGEEDEEQTVAENEEWAGVDTLTQDQGARWLHNRPGIMTEGRSTPWVDPDKEEEEEEEDEDEMSEEKKAALAAIEKPRKKLAAVEADILEDVGPCWTFRTAPNKYDLNCVSTAHSLDWPGAVSLARGKTVLNFYAGWGLPLSITRYNPPQPPAFAEEYSVELKEEEDVQPPEGSTFELPGDEEEEESDDEEAGEEKPDEGEEEDE